MTECAHEGCQKKPVAHGYCDWHYRQARSRGEIKARERDPEVRFWSNVDKTQDCWLWLRATDVNGYGRVGWAGKVVLAHRLAYELTRGAIAGGLPLDHLCRTPRCVNPDHLEPVETRENTARGEHVSAQALRTNHCIRGHEFTEANTYTWRGERQCRRCQRVRRQRSASRSQSPRR